MSLKDGLQHLKCEALLYFWEVTQVKAWANCSHNCLNDFNIRITLLYPRLYLIGKAGV